MIAVPSSEVEERVSEPEVYITSPEAIVEEVEAVQVETAVETNGATSIVSKTIHIHLHTLIVCVEQPGNWCYIFRCKPPVRILVPPCKYHNVY